LIKKFRRIAELHKYLAFTNDDFDHGSYAYLKKGLIKKLRRIS